MRYVKIAVTVDEQDEDVLLELINTAANKGLFENHEAVVIQKIDHIDTDRLGTASTRQVEKMMAFAEMYDCKRRSAIMDWEQSFIEEKYNV